MFKNIKIHIRGMTFKDVLMKINIYLSYSLHHKKVIVCILGIIYLLTIFLSAEVYFKQLMLITVPLRVYFVSNIILIEQFKRSTVVLGVRIQDHLKTSQI